MGFWLIRARIHQSPAPETGADIPTPALSAATKAVLARLKSPVDLRFYALLDPATTSASLKTFAGRADQWVSIYEREAQGRIKVTRFSSPSYATATAAAKDGIQCFDADKGEGSFLGVALELNGHRESLAHLNPAWESALESDLTRALARLLESTRPAPPPVEVARSYANSEQEVKTLIPNITAVSLEEGTRLLRESVLKEFQAAVRDGEALVKEAQQKLTEAKSGKSAAEQEAARKNLLQVQESQMERLKTLAAKSQAQVEAFQRLKSGSP